MKRIILTVLTLAMIPATSMAQSDLEKVLRGLQQIQEMQRRGQPRQNRPPGNGPNVPAQGNPNSSGGQNGGNFRNPGQMFPGQNPGFQQPGYQQPGFQPPRYQQPQYQQPARPQRTYSNQPIVIHCDPEAPTPCRYSLVTLSNRSFPYEIKPGQLQTFPENTDWNLSYQPTGSGPWRTYRLRGGKHYELRRADSRWQLYLLE